jgi:protein disulfide-isomerase-like protein
MQLINFKSILTVLAVFAAVANAAHNYVITVNDKTFDSVVNGERNVLVKFYASWCGPCKRLAPTIEAVSRNFPNPKGDVIIVQIDASKNRKIANRYNVNGFPTMKFFPKGSKKPIEYDGKRTEDSILSFINKHAVLSNSASSKAQAQPGCIIGASSRYQENNAVAPLMSHTDVQQVNAAELREILANSGNRPVIAFFYSPSTTKKDYHPSHLTNLQL